MTPISVRCTNFWLPSWFPSPQFANSKVLTFIFQLISLIFNNNKKTHVTPKVYKLQVQGTIESMVVKGEWIPSTEFERYPVLAGEHSLNPEHLRNTKPATSIRTSSSLSHSCYIPNGKETHPLEGYRKERKETCLNARAPSNLQTHSTALCTSRSPKYRPVKPWSHE